MSKIAPVQPEIPRDRYGRPLVIPPTGGKPVAYTRCTTFIDVLDDKFNLQQWMQRMVALGLAQRPEMLTSVLAAKDDKKTLNRIVDEARELAGASTSASHGTAIHSFTEVIDRGGDIPGGLPPAVLASLYAYRHATADLTYTHIEQFCVQDKYKIGGTPDRIGSKIMDLKTGSIEYGALKIAMQLAVYARSSIYDVATGERSHHGADVTEGIVIHLPAVDDPGDATCTLYAVNLELGWEALMLAAQVREKRGIKFKDLMVPLGTPKTPKPEKTDVTLQQVLARAGGSTEDLIASCTTPDQVRALWRPEWSDDLVVLAAQRVAELEVPATA